MARSVGASRWRIFTRITLPSAVPFIVVGLRVGATIGLINTVVAELYTAVRGLGGLLAIYGNTFRMAEYFVIVLILAADRRRRHRNPAPSPEPPRALARRRLMLRTLSTKRPGGPNDPTAQSDRAACRCCRAAARHSLAAAAPFRLILTHLEPPLVPNSVMDLALEKGYFASRGRRGRARPRRADPVGACRHCQAGEGEMANVGVDGLLLLVAQGATDLKAVTSPNKSLPYVIAAKDDIKTVADLAGRIFGVGRVGSLDHSLSMKVLVERRARHLDDGRACHRPAQRPRPGARRRADRCDDDVDRRLDVDPRQDRLPPPRRAGAATMRRRRSSTRSTS